MIYRFCILTCAVLFSLSVSAQERNVKLSSGNIVISQAFKEIGGQTGYHFAYSRSTLDVSKKANVTKTEAPLSEIMTQLLSGTNCNYTIRDSYIFISQKNPNNLSGTTAVPAVTTVAATKGPATRDPVVNPPVMAAPGEPGDSSRTLVFYFRFQKSLLERDYLRNNTTFAELDALISDREAASRVTGIDIIGSSSPDGLTSVNDRIALERARAVKGYIMWKYPHMNREIIGISSVGENWEGLRQMVEADPNVPSRDEALKIISLPIESMDKEARLRNLAGGATFGYMINNMLRYLRTGTSCVVFFGDAETETAQPEPDSQPAIAIIPESEGITTTDTVTEMPDPPLTQIVADTDIPEPDNMQPDPDYSSVQPDPAALSSAGAAHPRNNYYWALKTNMAYNALLLPNLSAEFSLGKKWSLGVEGIYSWWKFGNTSFERVQIGGVELRKWFGRKSSTPLNGYFVGAYAMAGTYDIQTGGYGYLSDFSYSAGLTFGYSMPIARRLNLELGIGLGYFGGEYKKYTYDATENCYPWLGTFERHYIGPTKANVSLVWLLGGGTNSRKR